MLSCNWKAWYRNIADNRCMPSNSWYATVPPHPARLDECHVPSDPGGYDKKNSMACLNSSEVFWNETKWPSKTHKNEFCQASFCPSKRVQLRRSLSGPKFFARLQKQKSKNANKFLSFRLWDLICIHMAARWLALHQRRYSKWKRCVLYKCKHIRTKQYPISWQYPIWNWTQKTSKTSTAFHQFISCCVIPLKLMPSIVLHVCCHVGRNYTWFHMAKKWKTNSERRCMIAKHLFYFVLLVRSSIFVI